MKASQIVSLSYLNRGFVEASEKCGCFACLRVFPAAKVELWSDSDDPADEDPGALRGDDSPYPGRTAICPLCESDCVVPDASFADFSTERLREAHDYWCRSG